MSEKDGLILKGLSGIKDPVLEPLAILDFEKLYKFERITFIEKTCIEMTS